jgi:hypothetical protein
VLDKYVYVLIEVLHVCVCVHAAVRRLMKTGGIDKSTTYLLCADASQSIKILLLINFKLNE